MAIVHEFEKLHKVVHYFIVKLLNGSVLDIPNPNHTPLNANCRKQECAGTCKHIPYLVTGQLVCDFQCYIAF